MPIKKSSAETVVVTIAESVGSALGALVATATRAKNALATKELTGQEEKRKRKAAIRRVLAKTVKIAKNTHKTSRRPSKKIHKTVRRPRKYRA